MVRSLLIAAGLLGFSAIALGAYGDHGLRGSIDADSMRSFETATRYQLFHALALLGLGMGAIHPDIPANLNKRLFYTGMALLAGTLIFSGSIYLKLFFGIEDATKLAPLGGITLMAGWLMLIWVGCNKKGAS